MSDIFSHAKRVVVWLGRAYNGSDKAMEALSRPVESRSQSSSGTTATKSIKALFNRPYWTRFWVFQDLKSAKKLTVMCGNSLPNWKLLETYVHRLYMDHQTEALSDSPAAQMILLRTRSMGTSVWHLLEATQHLCCTDSRDRVYALLSAATIGHEGNNADYTISASDLIFRVLLNISKIHPPTSCDEANARLYAIRNAFGVDPGFSIINPRLLNSGGHVTRARLYVDSSFDAARDLPSLGDIDVVPSMKKSFSSLHAT
jgi:hypothetical protein